MSDSSDNPASTPLSAVDAKAADYVLGVLDADEQAVVTDALAVDPLLRARVTFWQERFQVLADRIEPLEPGENTFRAIEAAIDGLPPPGSLTIRADEGDWQQLFAGVYKKALLVDEAEGAESFLLRIEPGAVCPAHSHTKTEECLVLEGEMIIGTARFAAGDYHAAPPKVAHLPITSEVGALLYVRAELHV